MSPFEVLAIISPSSYSWNALETLLKRVKCPPFLFLQPKQLNLVSRASRLTVHNLQKSCFFDVMGSLIAKFFQIWSSVVGYGESFVCI